VPTPLLVEFYNRLPQLTPVDDEDLWTAGAQDGMREFRDAVHNKYSEGTLTRMLAFGEVRTRRAAVLALGFIGTMNSNAAVATCLLDGDLLVQRFAADALWEIWFRAGTDEQNHQLQQALCQPDADRVRAALDDLIKAAPEFAEPYNQRAIVSFRRGEFARSVKDCEEALRLNPYHYGAASGMGQCFLRMKKPKAALRAFRTALEINPNLDNLRETIQALMEALGRDES
jgi:tetratricopeptide (TPR) repeat protein